MEETVRAFTWLVENNKALYWGTSEWSAEQIREAQSVAETKGLIAPVVEQPEYSMLQRYKVEAEFQPIFRSNSGLGITSYSALAAGVLTGKYNDGIPKDSRFNI